MNIITGAEATTSTQKLIDGLILRPHQFSRKDLTNLLNPLPPSSPNMPKEKGIDHEDLKSIIRRILDLNPNFNYGYANRGILGRLNRRSQKQRIKKFFKRIASPKISKKILVEGDSWFEHPVQKDTFDWLNELREDYALYSIAHGGDWLINIINEGNYINDLSVIEPDVLMLSGGGNDLVDDHRLAIMLDKDQHFYHESLINSPHDYADFSEYINDEHVFNQLSIGIPYLSKEFWAMLWTLELQYRFIIQKVHQKFPDLKIIILGYDYPIPSSSIGFRPFQALLNWHMRNGRWLKEALLLRNIHNANTQKAIMFSLIHLFNEMIVKISNAPNMKGKVFHLDGRNTATNKDDWFDELHLKSHVYERLAEKAIDIIDD